MAGEQTSSPRDGAVHHDKPSVITTGDSGRYAATQLVAALTLFAAGTWAIAVGAHIGLYGVRIGTFLIVIVAMLGGSVFVLRITRHLRRIDAERAADQERLRQSQERLDLALRGAELASWDWNIESGDIVFNDRWSEMRGYRSGELAAHFDQFLTGLHPEDRPRVQRILDEYLRGDSGEYESEHRIQTKTGEWIWIHGRGKVFARDEEGRPVRMVGVSRDISKRKQLEAELRLAIQARDEVLGVVAHDLRNPLGTILIETAYLQRAPSRAGAIESTANIERAAMRMHRLIQDLIDITRMDAGPLPLNDERLDTGRLLSDVIELQIPLVSSCGLELLLASPRELPNVSGDRDRLLQVFENLIGNALKFTEPGGRITIAATTRDESGDVLFSVSDTGAGVSAKDIPHLFDRFWQARERERRGAGLGLPIAKGIVEAHGGRIWVDSMPHRGSTFFFSLPALSKTGPKPALRKRTSDPPAMRV